MSCLDQDTNTLKKELNLNQIEVLSYVNESIEIINDRRSSKNTEKEEKKVALEVAFTAKELTQERFDEQIKALKPGKLFSAITESSTDQDFWNVLDDTLLDQLLRYRKDEKGAVPFQALPV